MPFRNTEKGFTLVEVMIALVIFMIGSLGLLPLLVNGMQTNQKNALHERARHLAGSAMTNLQLLDYATLVHNDNLSRHHGPITLHHVIEPNRPATGQTRITVTATWKQNQRDFRYQLQTFRAEP